MHPAPSMTPIYDQLADEFTPDDNPPEQPADPEIRTPNEDR